jgi:hypothetical protein
MEPTAFKESNITLHRPQDMTAEECSPLSVFSNGRECISCWKPSLRERISILLFGKVWLYVVSGYTQPPVALLGQRRVFGEQKFSARMFSFAFYCLTRFLLNPLIDLRRKIKDYRRKPYERLDWLQKRLERARVWLFRQYSKRSQWFGPREGEWE